MLPRLAKIDYTLRSFRYKFSITCYLSTKSMHFGIRSTFLCSFSSNLEESLINILYYCIYCMHIKSLWQRLETKFQNDIILLSLTPQSAILGLAIKENNIYKLLNYILFVFRYYVHRSREIDNLIKLKGKKND